VFQQVGSRVAAEPLGDRVGVQEPVGVRVEEEQGVPGLLEQRPG
jgi:hypothetical protein